ncbi:MAG: DUF4189 domain-containing protein [Pseudonocardiaceae bacterium]
MYRRLLGKFSCPRGSANHRSCLHDDPRAGAESKIGGRSRRVCSRDGLCEQLHRVQTSSVAGLSFRRRIGLALFGALVVALFPATPANAAQREYGSIAYSGSTAIAAVGFAGSMNDAALTAIEQCHAQGGASDCAAYGWFYQGYGAFAHGSGTEWGFGWGTNAGYAASYAMQYCQQNSSDNSCQITSRAQTPGVADESPSATGGTFSTPITPPSTPTYQTPPTYESPPTYTLPTSANVSVPDLLGLSLSNARQTLPQGLQLGTITGNAGTVVDQQPKAGDLVPPNTRVDLVLGAPGFPTWLAVLLVVLAILALLVARILRQRAQRRHWNARIRIESALDPNPTTRLREPGKTARFTVQVEVHPDQGVQNVREVVTR